MKMVLGLSAILAGVGLAMAQQRDFQPPSATGVQSRCAELGEKILEEQAMNLGTIPSQVSHYDPRTNRCYVELNVLTNDINTFHRYLYDGQTKEVLATASTVKGNKEGAIFDKRRNPTGDTHEYFEADKYIDEMMAEDRK